MKLLSKHRVMKAGDAVECINDAGFHHPSPVKGGIYQVRKHLIVAGVHVISVMQGHPEHFYRVSRFQPVLTRA